VPAGNASPNPLPRALVKRNCVVALCASSWLPIQPLLKT
jgi:hypothetical protein